VPAVSGVLGNFIDYPQETARAITSLLFTFLDTVPVSQVLFGTDYPFVEVADDVSGFSRLQLSAARRHAIERGIAERLLPRFRA
jgi:predicted TIM-barrel fold metal-dependent hydrolase